MSVLYLSCGLRTQRASDALLLPCGFFFLDILNTRFHVAVAICVSDCKGSSDMFLWPEPESATSTPSHLLCPSLPVSSGAALAGVQTISALKDELRHMEYCSTSCKPSSFVCLVRKHISSCVSLSHQMLTYNRGWSTVFFKKEQTSKFNLSLLQRIEVFSSVTFCYTMVNASKEAPLSNCLINFRKVSTV